MSDITRRILSAGYWRVTIHPASFREKRVANILALFPIVQKSAVEVRGWDFPHVDRHADPVPNLDFIEQETEWEHTAEKWRFYQSGQFAVLRAMPYDWRDRSGWWPPDAGWKRGGALGIGDALFQFFEIFEFAARLSNTEAGDDHMRVGVEIGGLRDRALVVDDPRRLGFPRNRNVATIDTFPIDAVHARTDLLANASDLAVAAARELFARFGKDLSAERLREWLNTLLRAS